MVVFAAAFILQTAALLLRWYISDRWPNSNMFEAVTTSAWFGSCLAIVVEIVLRRTDVSGLFRLISRANLVTSRGERPYPIGVGTAEPVEVGAAAGRRHAVSAPTR